LAGPDRQEQPKFIYLMNLRHSSLARTGEVSGRKWRGERADAAK
jgi:hypothetical protein